MSLEITVKNAKGETTERRGKRRAVVDGKLMNQALSTKTGEWAESSVVKTEIKEAAIDAELVSIMTKE